MTRLERAVVDLYEVFRAYRPGDRIEGCPCCVTNDMKIALHRVPLGDLSWADLKVYSAKALTTFGTERDFKHFLPRLLELSATQPGEAPFGLEMTLGKLVYAKWDLWPERERAVVKQYADALGMALADPTNAAGWDDWEREEVAAGLAAIRGESRST